MRSRACQIAATVRMADGGPLNFEARRKQTICHACCEGDTCGCPCHRGEIELTGARNDLLPLITVRVPGSVPLPAAGAELESPPEHRRHLRSV